MTDDGKWAALLIAAKGARKVLRAASRTTTLDLLPNGQRPQVKTNRAKQAEYELARLEIAISAIEESI